MRKVGAFVAIGALAAALSCTPAAAFGLRIGPFHLGLPFFGHHRHHHSIYMHANRHEVARSEEGRPEAARPQAAVEPAPAGAVSPALLYPSLALPVIFQNVFWPQSSPWPFGYQNIFTTAFARTPGGQNQRQCQQPLDANAMVGRMQEEVSPTQEQMPPLQKLGGALAAASGYLSKSCVMDIPSQPTARLQFMESRIEELAMAIDIIRGPLQDFEQSLTADQQSRFAALPASQTSSAKEQSAAARPCGGSRAAIDWSIRQINQSVQPTEAQQSALADVKQAFSDAADDLEAHCPTSVPSSPLGRLRTIEARLDSAWRAVLSMQVALANFEAKLSDQQRNRFDAMNFASR
jgi:hypothetical protein